VALAAGPLAADARAAQCGKPDLVDMVPPDLAKSVPQNAMLGAHYTAAAEYAGEEVLFVHPDGSVDHLTRTSDPPVLWDGTEQLLSVRPNVLLGAGQDYEIRWPALRALNAAAPGLSGNARFTTSLTSDTEAPSFPGVVGLSWDLERVQNDCFDELVERFVFDIDLGPATDDGGTDGLTLLLFQTAGPQITADGIPFPGRAWPGTHTEVRLAKEDAVGEICFAAIVRDTTGQISQSGDVEACVHTTDPPFFRGCSVAGPGGGGGGTVLSLALAAALACLLRRGKR
jgi:hypothetical protein